MDRLEEVLDTATPLLRRVDEVLGAAGAPAGHALWAELRRVRLLPGDAVLAVSALTPSALAGAAPELRSDARAYAEVAAGLPAPGEWTGDAADAYDDLRRRTAAHLSGDHESLDERLEATADLAEALTDWMAETRARLAATLAEILASGDALTLLPPTTPPPMPQVIAAADIAAHLLRSIADSYSEGTDLLHNSTSLTTPFAI
ncbi:MAG TPA: hypothetical protein VGB74_20095 [Actinoplanes sp.]|jgi:hypothetical protein